MTKKSAITVAEKADLAEYDVLSEGIEEIKSIIQANVGDMENINEFTLSRAKNPSGDGTRFEIPGLEEPEFTSKVEGIIVAHTKARAYYEKSYDETGGGEQPDCMSRDGITGEGNPGGFCARCQLARFTKDDAGKSIQPPCRQFKRLFILMPGDIMPTMFNASAGNIGQVDTYMFNLSTKGRIKFNHCITRIEVTADKYKNGRHWAKWNLKYVAALPPELREQMDGFNKFLMPIIKNIDITAEDVEADDLPKSGEPF